MDSYDYNPNLHNHQRTQCLSDTDTDINLQSSIQDCHSSCDSFTSDVHKKISISQKRFDNMCTTQKFCDWLRYEWCYSSIDREIFLGPTDFQSILQVQFPMFRTKRMLTRGHWALIRRMIGRPRRFSATFLSEERESVRGKRRNFYYLHLILAESLGPVASEQLGSLLTCMPAGTKVPPRLPIGTRVSVSLCTPFKGIYSGVIHDPYPENGYYGVWIDEVILCNGQLSSAASNDIDLRGFRIVPEEDVFPFPGQSLPQSIPLSEIRYYFKENLVKSESGFDSIDYHVISSGVAHRDEKSCDRNSVLCNRFGNQRVSTDGDDGPLLGDGIDAVDCSINAIVSEKEFIISETSKVAHSATDAIDSQPNITPVVERRSNGKLCTSLAKLYRMMDEKRAAVERLREMNNTAEAKLADNPENITVPFQHAYATLILQLDNLNQQLKYHMDVVLMEVTSLAQEHNMMQLNYITDWRRRCDDEAQEIITRVKSTLHQPTQDDCKIDLVAKLTSMLIHLSNLPDHRVIGQSLSCIENLLKEIRSCLYPANIKCFEATVEAFIGQIVNAVTANPSIQEYYPLPSQAPTMSFSPSLGHQPYHPTHTSTTVTTTINENTYETSASSAGHTKTPSQLVDTLACL